MFVLANSLVVCGIYYYLWVKWIPSWKGYKLRQEVVNLGGGAEAHRLSKVRIEDLEKWDESHNAAGNVINRAGIAGDSGTEMVSRLSRELDSKDVNVQAFYV